MSAPARCLRVALILYGSLDTLSGGYLYDRRLVQRLEQRGHHVEIVSLPWRSYPRHLADTLSPRWRRRVAAIEADLVLQDELNHPSLAFVNSLPGRGARPPVIAIVHHLRASERHPALLRPLYRAVERRYLNTVDGFLCNSETTRASVAALLRRSPARTVVAYPAGDHILRAAAASALASLREESGALQVAFVGNLIPRKGLHILLDALALMRHPASLTVAGSPHTDPHYARRMRSRAAAPALAGRVRFAGPIPDAEVAALYARSDVLALPSYEGFGIAYLEAMALGCPVIAATAGAAHEIVTPGTDGFLVAPDDPAALAAALDALAADPALRARMRSAARARFEHHPTWAESMDRAAAWLEEFAA